MNNSNIKTISVIKMIGQGDYISLSYFLSLWYNTNVKILSLLSGKFRYIFLCSDSGDWGHPSASIVYRFPRNLWERDTVLAGLVFTLFWDIKLSCCLFHYSGAWGSIPQQAMRGVVTGFRGNELPCLLRWIFAILGHLCIRAFRLGIFAHLWFKG